eukprot:GFUD01109867.1.p1 GENE.GFUD01109867.1~~GFUD01109867.1.p1  ORF type:complete len:262 (+),score=60.23 GFUD01109867.1:47-832(+)
MFKALSKQTSLKKCKNQNIPDPNEDDITYQHASAFKTILFHFNTLKSEQELFDQFMEVVDKDVKSKTNVLKWLRLNDHITTNQNMYAAVQIFMLKLYSTRIKSFQKASEKSFANIYEEYCKDNRDSDKVSDLVNKHIQVLVKMKRRMKHIIDVSEKYAVIDLFENIHVLSEQRYDLDPSCSLKDRKDIRLTKSLTSLSNDANTDFNTPSFSRMPSPSLSYSESSISHLDCQQIVFGKQSLRPLKSLSDHMFVLTKTYTSKQ